MLLVCIYDPSLCVILVILLGWISYFICIHIWFVMVCYNDIFTKLYYLSYSKFYNCIGVSIWYYILGSLNIGCIKIFDRNWILIIMV